MKLYINAIWEEDGAYFRSESNVPGLHIEELARLTEIPPKSLSRMFGPKGNPTSKNLQKVINAPSEYEGIRLRVIAEER